MKMIKMALLGGAALAVTAGVARADELADLKAQVESLNARVAQMEAAPAVPAGYSLLTISEAQGSAVPGLDARESKDFTGSVHVMSVVPTADAPAAASVEWSGFVRAILAYRSNDPGADDSDVVVRGQVNVAARTDTAVGEVGVNISLRGDWGMGAVMGNAGVTMPNAWGWWAMTPELTLGGGFTGSLGSNNFGYDGACTCNFIDNADVYANNASFGGTSSAGDTTQMRLTYASGPLTFAVALEDASSIGVVEKGLGVAGRMTYAGDTFSAGLMGNYRATNTTTTTDSYHFGGGLGFNMDPLALSLAAGMGQNTNALDYWYVNALASMDLSDDIHMELGAGYKDYQNNDNTVMAVMGGLYYVPVDQLTIGLEGEWMNVDPTGAGNDVSTIFAGFVTRYNF